MRINLYEFKRFKKQAPPLGFRAPCTIRGLESAEEFTVRPVEIPMVAVTCPDPCLLDLRSREVFPNLKHDLPAKPSAKVVTCSHPTYLRFTFYGALEPRFSSPEKIFLARAAHRRELEAPHLVADGKQRFRWKPQTVC